VIAARVGRRCLLPALLAGALAVSGCAAARPSLRVPCGRVHWAGTETSPVWSGYIEGAIERGLRTGLEASQLIQRERNDA